MWDMWIYLQVAKRVLAGEKIADADAFELLFGAIWDGANDDFSGDQRRVNQLLWDEYRTFTNPSLKAVAQAIANDADQRFGTTAEDGSYIPAKMKMEAKQLAPYAAYVGSHGLTWPVREVDGQWLSTKWRFSDGPQTDGYDQVGIEMYGQKGLAGGLSFYKTPACKPAVVFRPWEPPAYSPDADYPFWFVTGRLLEQWHTGSNSRRVPGLNNALPEALLYMNPEDCHKLDIADGDLVKVSSVYGSFEVKATNQQNRIAAPTGFCFAPFFSEEHLVNLAVEDIYDPLSKEPDFKKTVVKIEKV
jgi:nitrate reductase NapA